MEVPNQSPAKDSEMLKNATSDEGCNYMNPKSQPSRNQLDSRRKHASDLCETCVPLQNCADVNRDLNVLQNETNTNESRNLEFLCVENLRQDLSLPVVVDCNTYQDVKENKKRKKKTKKRRKKSRGSDIAALEDQ